MNTPHPYDLLIGLDRSDRKADLHLIHTRTGQRHSQIIDTAPEALWEWLLQQTIQTFDQEIARAFGEHPDQPIFSSLPGAGPVLAPRLLATFGAERGRFQEAGHLQCYTGVAPVTKRSGGKCHIHRRYCCPKFHRQSFHEYAKESILWSRWAAAYYLQQRTKGCHHHTAVRALAFKWQRVIWRCWQNRTPYEENIYEAALRKANSPLVALLDHVELGKSPFKNPVKKT